VGKKTGRRRGILVVTAAESIDSGTEKRRQAAALQMVTDMAFGSGLAAGLGIIEAAGNLVGDYLLFKGVAAEISALFMATGRGVHCWRWHSSGIPVEKSGCKTVGGGARAVS